MRRAGPGVIDACQSGEETVSRLGQEHLRRKLRKVPGLRRTMDNSAMLAEALAVHGPGPIQRAPSTGTWLTSLSAC